MPNIIFTLISPISSLYSNFVYFKTNHKYSKVTSRKAYLIAKLILLWRQKLSQVLFVFCCTISLGCMASVDIELTDEETKALAEKYISSLDNDLDLQASFYTSNTRFIDPTSDLFGPAWDIVGGDKIIEFFKNASEESGTIAVKYKITNMLIERNYVVSNITSTVTACAVGLGFPKKSFTGDIDMVMMLQFEGESIQQRMDYVAYSAAWETMEQLQVNLADKNDDPRCSHHE